MLVLFLVVSCTEIVHQSQHRLGLPRQQNRRQQRRSHLRRLRRIPQEILSVAEQ